ncbi:MAG: acyltransferase [Bacteroides sp.]|nr:acyltransferase [Bacteroides sp.]MCM1413141.1 acyltransferase [Bacteroides sp.]MCM1472117.1 acyltransferase [Bacteroides sp.]
METQYDFSDIAPFDDIEFSEKMHRLVEEPGFEAALKSIMPTVDYAQYVELLKSIPDKETLQREVMYPLLKMLQSRTTSGITSGGLDNFDAKCSYTIMSNHRDIVLDASFLNLCLLENGKPTSEIAIGSNLLIYDWITDLVKLNKSFIVKRNIERKKALEAAFQLSAYIHYAIGTKHESVWIAQREGRAKDSNDRTQDSLIKMLSLEGEGAGIKQHLLEINIMPLSISYEYDPNDYLKAREFLCRRLDPDFKKSEHDDLLSMETGLLQPKGRIHFQLGKCINDRLRELPDDMPKAELIRRVCDMIDQSIHCGYRIYPVNYIAYDRLHQTDRFADHYTPAEQTDFEAYIDRQLSKVDIADLSQMDLDYMRQMIYTMYSNPLKNKLAALESEEKSCD